VLVRPIALADLDAIKRLESAAPEAPRWPHPAYESFLTQSPPLRRIFVAEDRNRLLGFVAAQIVADACELQSIVVDPAAHRTGVATALLASLSEWARQRGAIRVEIEVRAGNTSAIAFYKRAGFSTDGLRRLYYRDPDDDAVLMSRPLQPNHAS
jgi:[ribosomal protein S18]-alanine N-acetyltransferase